MEIVIGNKTYFLFRITYLNILKHYNGFVYLTVFYLLLYFGNIIPLFFLPLLMIISLLFDLISIPLLIKYLKVKDQVLISKNEIRVNDEIINLDETKIKNIEQGKPLANVGGLAVANFNYIKIFFYNGRQILITSIMYGKELDFILKEFPDINVTRKKCLFCLFENT